MVNHVVSAFLGLCLTLVGAAPTPALPQEGAASRPAARPGAGGFGGTPQPDRKLVKTFDIDGDGQLGTEERHSARASIKKERAAEGGEGRMRPRGPGGPGGFGGRANAEPPKPGPEVRTEDVKPVLDAPLYDPTVLRTLFLDFEDADWGAEMSDFYGTDVDVPATLTVDGKKYPGVGVHFRGASSFFTVGAGQKRSLNVSLDHVDGKQSLYGHQTLNLLNSHTDPTFMHSVLYLDIARRYAPAPRANFVKVVINGESWGVYINQEQFDKTLVADAFKSAKGSRWKVKGSPRGGGGLDYIGDDVEEYKKRYEIKAGGGKAAWQKLITLCRTLTQTPVEDLEKALEPMLDVDGVLWFLALEMAFVNGDGYWVRASDYGLCLDDAGVFHVLIHDANETFQPAGGGFGGGRRGAGGPPPGFGPDGPPPDDAASRPASGQPDGERRAGGQVDPLVAMDDAGKPLRSKLLAVPAYRERYLSHLRTLAEEWLDWNKLAPLVRTYRSLIETELAIDTRKLSTMEAFARALSETVEEPVAAPEGERRGRRPQPTMKAFVDQRRKYLLEHPALQPTK